MSKILRKTMQNRQTKCSRINHPKKRHIKKEETNID